jgi:large subunit ribosomal protein L24
MQTTKPIKDPRKQRKLLHNAPAHLRHKLMAAPLSPQLTASKSVKTLPVRKGDTVRIMRGDNKGFEGKISRVDLKNYRVYLEGLTREKVDGTTIFLPIHPSKVMIKNLNLSDKWRKAIVDRKEALHKAAAKAEKAMEKPPAKAAKVEKEVKRAIEGKPVKAKEKIAEAKAAVEEKPAEAKPKAKPAKAPTKARKKPASKKKKEAAPTEKEKLTEKEKKPKAPKTAKKTRTKRKTAAEEKEGGT